MDTNKLPIIEKAYCIDLYKIRAGFMWSIFICYASNINKAKQLLLAEVKYEDMELENPDPFKPGGIELTYLNIPVKRHKDADKVLFEGEIVKRGEIPYIIKERERKEELQAILDCKETTHCYIYKGGYYRPNSAGYTDMKIRAGVYTKQEAVEHAKRCREIRLVKIDNQEHNLLILDEIKSLKSRLIKAK